MKSRLDPLTVLIIDPRPVVSHGLSHIIQERFPSAHVGEVDTIANALNMVRRISWNLVFLNLPLAEIQRSDAISQLREWIPEAKVLTLSDKPDEDRIIQVLRHGASGFLPLDATGDQITEAINDVRDDKVHVTESLREQILHSLIQGEEKPATKQLSKRESEVLQGLASGFTSQELAHEMGLSATTISTFRNRLMKKLGLKSTADIVRYAIDHDIPNVRR